MKKSADTYQPQLMKQTPQTQAVEIAVSTAVPAPFTSYDKEKAALILLGIQLQLSGKPS